MCARVDVMLAVIVMSLYMYIFVVTTQKERMQVSDHVYA